MADEPEKPKEEIQETAEPAKREISGDAREVVAAASTEADIGPPFAAQVEQLKSLREQAVEASATSDYDAIAHSLKQQIENLARELDAIKANRLGINTYCPGLANCPDCECVSPGCCCFEIVFGSVRALQGQGGFEGKDSVSSLSRYDFLECKFFASVGNIGCLVPGNDLSNNLSLSIQHKVGSEWQLVNRVIGKVCLRHNSTKQVIVEFNGEECDVNVGEGGSVRGRSEFGNTTGTIDLNCCSDKIYPPQPVTIEFTRWGGGGGKPGLVEISYHANRIC